MLRHPGQRRRVPKGAEAMAQTREVDEVSPEQSAPAPIPDLDSPLLYLNRELTWLGFNRRVLAEAQDRRNPPLERLKFLAITASNLDEFFMKRIGGLKQDRKSTRLNSSHLGISY